MSEADSGQVGQGAAPPAGERPRPGLADLFLAFAGVAVIGFGGVLPWIRRMLVEQRGWLTPHEFVEALSLAQLLPGGNVLNLAVAVGSRFRGPLGALVSMAGLLIGPFVIMIVLGMIYLRYGQSPAVHDALTGMAAAGAGLILSMAAKMAAPLWRRGDVSQLVVAAAAFIGIAVLRAPLFAAVAVLAPLSIALAWFRRAGRSA